MELIERDEFLDTLRKQFENLSQGEGHCIFVSGEAGIGKTSLVKAFCKEQRGNCNIYQGACDALFTPRPLAPLYDIIWQVNSDLWPKSHTLEERSELFTGFFRELSNQKERSLIVFEDIHWADEATLDFIKFFARRITQLQCLFILTYRDNEIQSDHPLRTVLGQLPPDLFTRMQLTPLSRQAVDKLAEERGYSGEDVYSISGGNPFYVNELLSSYSLELPENIKDAIMSCFDRTGEKSKQVWELLSVIPGGLEIKYLEKFEPLYTKAIGNCVGLKVLIIENGLIQFKHELFRRTVESSMSPLKRVSLNKKILDMLLESFEQNQEIERIVHYAKNANEYETVIKYAPLAAREAAAVGAHIEASKLYLTAIEYYQGNDKDLLIQLYESYAYECYLTNQVREAIIYTGKSLNGWKEKKNIEKTGNSMRFLSRLWWLDNNRKNAGTFAAQAIEVLSSQPASSIKAMAFSNMSQLKMLSDQYTECVSWGEKAIELAREIGDEETLSHALNNVGSVKMHFESSEDTGLELLQQSLGIALENGLHEHAARAYSNMASNALSLKKYSFARVKLEEGIQYCKERDLDSWRSNMLSFKANLHLETGDWKEACSIAETLLKNENQLPTITYGARAVLGTIKMWTGEDDSLPLLLEAGKNAFATMGLQYIIPALTALLQYEWLTAKTVIWEDDLNRATEAIVQSINRIENSEFAFWLLKARKKHLPLKDIYEGYDTGTVAKAQKAEALWEKLGCPYVQAIVLFEGNDNDKRKAITIMQELGATAVYERMKLGMRVSGIKNIPRGIRKATRSNPALLTDRELDILQLLPEGLQNKEIASRLFIATKTVDHHISSILYKLEVNSRAKAVQEAAKLGIIK